MKKLLTSIFLLLFFLFCSAQKMAYVDTKYILDQIPQYQQAQQRLDSEIKKWQNEIQKEQSNLDRLRVEFENEKVLLTDEQQKNKLAIIDSTEIKIKDFIEQKFGTHGESIRLRMNFVKPLQDQIWNAVNTIAIKERYGMIFDKSSDLIMVFSDSKYDITDKVLKQLGVDAKKNERKEAKSNSNTGGYVATPDEFVEDGSGSDNVGRTEETNTIQQPKSGYGSKYVPKKKQQPKTEVKKETKENTINSKKEEKVEAKSTIVEETKEETTDTKKAQTGYGSKYVPKKKQQPETAVKKENEEDVNIKKEEPTETKTSTTSKTEVKKETTTTTTTTQQPKTGYGSKYVPKKKKTNSTNNSAE